MKNFIENGVTRATINTADAYWLVRRTPDRAVRVRVLARATVLCSWARYFTFSASFRPGV